MGSNPIRFERIVRLVGQDVGLLLKKLFLRGGNGIHDHQDSSMITEIM
jgi:hypothetical protein